MGKLDTQVGSDLATRIGVQIGAFDPSDVSGYVLDLDAARGVSLSGSDVTDWADQSANGYDCTQATAANRPTYTPSNGSYNGKPTIDFNSANSENLKSTSFGTILAGDSVTLFVVGHNVGNMEMYFNSSSDSGVNNGGPMLFSESSNQFQFRLRAGGTAVWDGVTYGTPRVFECLGSSAERHIYENGVLRASETTAGQGIANNNTFYRVGAIMSGAYYLDGSVARVILYKGLLSSSDRESVRKHLGSLYGVAVS